MVKLHVAVLGPTEARLDGRLVALRSSRQRRLLAALVLWRQGASTSRLADAVWGEALPRDPAGALANQVSRLRRLLGDESIHSIDGGYRLGPGVACDVDSLEDVVVNDRVRGAPFDSLDIEDVEVETVRITEQLLALHEARAEQLWRDGDAQAAATSAGVLVTAHPLRERAHIVLAHALAAMGRRADALRQLDDYRVRLVTELGMDPSSTFQVTYRRLLGEERSVLRRRPVRTTSPLIGRDNLVTEVSMALTHHRLVTLSGTGGVGKTALALAVGERAGSETIDLISLGDVARDGDVAAAVASQLNIDAADGTSLTQRITDALAFEDGIVILDNAEHVLGPVATLVDELLARSGVRILVTSRARLGHPDELTVEVPPLAADADGDPACELFINRARNAQPRWTPDDAAEVTGICQRLDGLPLAIELAAAQLATRTFDEVVAGLDDPLDLLRGHRPDRGLRAVVARSIELLDPEDQAILDQIAVFHGGVSDDALECACRDLADARAVRSSLDRLVRASLLTRTEHRYGNRYVLLAPIRAVVLDGTRVRSDAIVGRYANAMIGVVEHGAIDAYGPSERAWAERLVDERSNILGALDHFVGAADATSAARLAIAAYLIGIPRRHVDLTELPGVVADLADHVDLDPALRIEVLGLASDAAAYGGDPDRARSLIDGARKLADRQHAHRYCDAVRADLALYDGDIDVAVQHLRRASVGFARHGQAALDAWMRATICLARSYAGNVDDQVGDALAVLADAERTGCPSTIAFTRYVYAEVVRPRDRTEARRQYEQSLKEALSVDAFFVAGLVRVSLATDAIDDGDAIGSAVLLADAITEWLRLGNWPQQATTLRSAAILLHRVGNHQAALTILLTLDELADHDPWGSDATAVGQAIAVALRLLSDHEVVAVREAVRSLDRIGLVARTLAALDAIRPNRTACAEPLDERASHG